MSIARSIKNLLELQTKANRMHPGSGTINLIISTSKLPFLAVIEPYLVQLYFRAFPISFRSSSSAEPVDFRLLGPFS